MTEWVDDENGGTVWSDDETGGSAFSQTVLDLLAADTDAEAIAAIGAATAADLTAHISDTDAAHDASAITVTQSGSGAISDTVQEAIRNQAVNVMGFIPVAERAAIRAATSTTDLTTYIQAAIDACELSGRALYFPRGLYLVTNLTSDTAGLVMLGEGGHLRNTEIRGTATSGPVLRVKKRSPTIKGIAITSDDTRYAASTTTGHGIWFADDDTASPEVISRQNLEDVYVYKQPTDGIHSSNGCELSNHNIVTIQDSKRHGFVFDDGTRAGLTNKVTPPFHWTLRNVRALECGGYGYILGWTDDTLAARGLTAENLESLSCCWDSNHRISAHHSQVLAACGGMTFIEPDIEDQDYADSTTSGGNSRTALATPSTGIVLGRGRVTMSEPYFSSLVKSVNIGVSGVRIVHPQIFVGTYNIAQTVAFDVSVGSVTGVEVIANTANTPGATSIIATAGAKARANIDGVNRGGITLLGMSAATASVSVTTSEEVLATVAIPAGAMGTNGGLRVKATFIVTSSTNTKTCRVRLGGIGGAVLGSQATATSGQVVIALNTTIQNSAADAQVSNATDVITTSSATHLTGSVDTSAAVDLVITGQKATDSETITLQRYIVELIRP